MKKKGSLFLGLLACLLLSACGASRSLSVQTLSLAEKDITLAPGSRYALSPLVRAKDGTLLPDPSLRYESDNPTVASFSDSSSPSFTVSASAQSGDKAQLRVFYGQEVASANLWIKEGVETLSGLTLDGSLLALEYGQAYLVSPSGSPSSISARDFSFTLLDEAHEPLSGVLAFALLGEKEVLKVVGTGQGFLQLEAKNPLRSYESVIREYPFKAHFKETALQTRYPSGIKEEEIAKITTLDLAPKNGSLSLQDLAHFPALDSLHLLSDQAIAFTEVGGSFDLLVDGLALYDAYEKSLEPTFLKRVYPYSTEQTVIYYAIIPSESRSSYQVRFYAEMEDLLSLPSQTGYQSLGWGLTLEGSALVTSLASLKKRSKLYAHYSAKSYTITVYFAGKGVSGPSQSYSIRYDDPLPALPKPPEGLALYQSKLFSHYEDSVGKSFLSYGERYQVAGDLILYGAWYSEINVILDEGYARKETKKLAAFHAFSEVLPTSLSCPSGEHGVFKNWAYQGTPLASLSAQLDQSYDVSGGPELTLSSTWSGSYSSLVDYEADLSGTYRYSTAAISLTGVFTAQSTLHVPSYLEELTIEGTDDAFPIVFAFEARSSGFHLYLDNFNDSSTLPLDATSIGGLFSLTLKGYSAFRGSIKANRLAVSAPEGANLYLNGGSIGLEATSLSFSSGADQRLTISSTAPSLAVKATQALLKEQSDVLISGCYGSTGVGGSSGIYGQAGTSAAASSGKAGGYGYSGGDGSVGGNGGDGGDALEVGSLTLEKGAVLRCLGGTGALGGIGGAGGVGGRGGDGGSGVPASWPNAGNDGGDGGSGGRGGTGAQGGQGGTSGVALRLGSSLSLGDSSKLALYESLSGLPGVGGGGGNGGSGGSGGAGSNGGFWGSNVNGKQGVGGAGGKGGDAGSNGAYGKTGLALLLLGSVASSFSTTSIFTIAERKGGRSSLSGSSGGTGGNGGSGSTSGSPGKNGASGTATLSEPLADSPSVRYGSLPFLNAITFILI